jgi:hypothetical protein
MFLSRAQGDLCHFFCFLSRLLCVDWLESALKVSRILTSSSWSSLGLWTPSYSAVTWRRVLCSECGRGKAFAPLSTHLCSHLSSYQLFSPPYLYFIYFLHEVDRKWNLLEAASNCRWSLGIFCFSFLTSVAFKLQMLKCIMANMTDCHERFHLVFHTFTI